VYRFTPGTSKYVVAVDKAGDVVWYHESDGIFVDVRQLPSGNLLMTRDKDDIIEMDILGNVVREWHANNRSPAPSGTTSINTDSIHHEVVPLEGGTYLTLSSERRSFDEYPTSETDPTPRTNPTSVVGDVIIEFDADGSVVSETKLLDILDPLRIGYNALDVRYWNSHYSEFAPTVDWSHANGLIPSGGGSFIVSLRHQDAVVKIDVTGNLVWILGDPNGWGPAYQPFLLQPIGNPFAWPYHQHAPELTSSGSLLVYDNHNGGVFPPDPTFADTTSRAVEYVIDETAMTVRQVWEYAPNDLYTSFIGDADEMSGTGNVLITFGGLREELDGQPSARIVEVTHDAAPTIAWELRVEDTNPSGPGNYFIYRAERIAGLVP
jgi:hypothetical protein